MGVVNATMELNDWYFTISLDLFSENFVYISAYLLRQFLKQVLNMLQVGIAEAKVAVDHTGGMIVMAETFDSEQFKKSLLRLFDRDEEGLLKMFFNASVEVMTTKEVKVCGVIGPCSSLQKKGTPPYLNSISLKSSEISRRACICWTS